MSSEERGSSQLERRFQNVVQSVLVAAIIGGGVVMMEVRTEVAVTQNDIRTMSIRLNDFRSLAADRYTASQAATTNRPIITDLADHEARLRVLEKYYNAKTIK